MLQRLCAMQDVLEAAFAYIPDLTPVVQYLSPASGPPRGGTVISFQGSNLLPSQDFQDNYDGWFSFGLDGSQGGNASESNRTSHTGLVSHQKFVFL